MSVANFELLSLEAVRQRAEAAGFVRDVVLKNGRAVVMLAPGAAGEGEVEFLLPLDRNIGDYTLRMADAVAAIAIAEDIETLDLMRELLAASES